MTSHRDLASLFSEGAEKGKGCNMFIDGDTIFSYGYHFPIAKRIEPDFYIFNSSGYSSSTAKHKSYVRGVLRGEIVEIRGCKILNASKQIQHNKEMIEEHKGKLTRARVEHSKEYHKRQIEFYGIQNLLIVKLLKKVKFENWDNYVEFCDENNLNIHNEQNLEMFKGEV